MTRHQPLRHHSVNAIAAYDQGNEIRVGPRSVLDWPKTELRILIAIPAALHVLVLLSTSTAADFILRTVGAAPLSPGGRLALANARIVVMLVASLSTIIVGVALASATVRTLGRLRDAASAAGGILGTLPAGWDAVRLKVGARRDGDS